MNIAPHILILEDDPDRLARFTFAAQSLTPPSTLLTRATAPDMIAAIDAHLPHTRLISLDHDLLPLTPSSPDPGDGLQVAQHLARLRPQCPIIIHSSNAHRAYSMAAELRDAHCRVHLIAPLGPDWIESHWQSVAQSLLHPT